MTGFEPGDLAVGGAHEYVEILSDAAVFREMVHVTDEAGVPVQYVTGVTFNPNTGDLFTCGTPDLTAANCPHDLDWLPDDSGVLVAVVASPGHLELRKLDYDGNLLNTWGGLQTDAGWSQEPVKISVACDGRTVFYTDSLRTVWRYDIAARGGAGQQLDLYKQLPASSPYIYGGVRVLPSGKTKAIVAMTAVGDGPQLGVALADDQLHVWFDEVQPSSGVYHIQEHLISTGVSVGAPVATKADLGTTNDRTLALAANARFCQSVVAASVWVS